MDNETKDVVITVRVSKATLADLQREQREWSKAAGLRVTVSDVARRRLENSKKNGKAAKS
jgi:hypothetical protein